MSRKSRTKRRKQQKQQSQKSQRMTMIGIGAVVVILIVAVVVWRQSTAPGANLDLGSIPDNSVVYDSQGRDHINVTDSHDPYNSNPPTSGPHASAIRTRFYTQEFPDENMIHNLEHGHIWLSYSDPDDTEAQELFRTIQSQYPSTVVVTLRTANDSRIAVAAWTRLLKLEELDEDQIRAFIVRYIDKAPESVPG